MDLYANLPESITLQPLERTIVPTGLYLQLPEGTEAQIRPRSGLALNRGITLLNSPGTIDADYRGEVKCIIVNLSSESQTIDPGDRIAQMVVSHHVQVIWDITEQLDESERGTGGFGSTGTK
jgi:dUTP pyrophosphatase